MAKSNYNPRIHNRKSNRLKGFDYSTEGLYFLTICCQNMEHRFGEVIKDENANDEIMDFNDAGNMVNAEWLKLKTRFPYILNNPSKWFEDKFNQTRKKIK